MAYASSVQTSHMAYASSVQTSHRPIQAESKHPIGLYKQSPKWRITTFLPMIWLPNVASKQQLTQQRSRLWPAVATRLTWLRLNNPATGLRWIQIEIIEHIVKKSTASYNLNLICLDLFQKCNEITLNQNKPTLSCLRKAARFQN